MTNDPQFTVMLVKMLLFLLLMAGGAIGLLYLFKRVAPSAAPASGRQLINVLCSRPIAPKKSVALIQVPGKVLVIGMAGDNLSLLTRIEDPDIIDELSARPAQPGFSGLLSRFSSKSSSER